MILYINTYVFPWDVPSDMRNMLENCSLGTFSYNLRTVAERLICDPEIRNKRSQYDPKPWAKLDESSKLRECIKVFKRYK